MNLPNRGPAGRCRKLRHWLRRCTRAAKAGIVPALWLAVFAGGLAAWVWEALEPGGGFRLGVLVICLVLIAWLGASASRLEEKALARTKALRRERAGRRRVERDAFDLLQRQRQNIANELHDDLAQVLTAVSLKAKALEADLVKHRNAHAAEAAGLAAHLSSAAGKVRRISRGLCPPEIEFPDLQTALERLAAEVSANYGLVCDFHDGVENLHIGGTARAHLFRIAQQAVDNACRHAGARRITIRLATEESWLALSVEDDGEGFDPGVVPRHGLGLRTMSFRAGLLHGCLAIELRVGGGTRVRCRMPYPRHAECSGHPSFSPETSPPVAG